MSMNFVVARLGDHDLGEALSQSLEHAKEEATLSYDPKIWRNMIISSVVAHVMQHRTARAPTTGIDWQKLRQLELYLTRKLTVTFERNAPSDDHAGGSACLDLRSGVAWAY